eukprot:TRINITY_DN5303_c0_g1_i1.p2 TRINITY_DN5303_c0_g1~~TRINITY_DN5303_c0_g1_i1.p2  ORF type:complete len:228 (-),score=41.60 TRINITY_DN5303_c0_g1_i1:132-815(-)
MASSASAGGSTSSATTSKMMQYDYLVKLLIIGDSGVGKSSLLVKFVDGKFTAATPQTVGMDFKMKMLERGGKRVKLQIWDTAGQERFHTITQQYYRNAMGIVLVYDCTNDESFANVRKWAAQIKAHGAEEASLMLLGNKCDAENRVVDEATGRALAEEYNMPFIETSAKSGLHVDDAFVAVADAVRTRLENQESGVGTLLGPSVAGGIVLGGEPQEQRRGCCGGSKN